MLRVTCVFEVRTYEITATSLSAKLDTEELEYDSVSKALEHVVALFLGTQRYESKLWPPYERVYVNETSHYHHFLVDENGKKLDWDDFDNEFNSEETIDARNERIRKELVEIRVEYMSGYMRAFTIANAIFKHADVQSYLVNQSPEFMVLLSELRKHLHEELLFEQSVCGQWCDEISNTLPERTSRFNRTKTLLHWLALVGRIDELDPLDRFLSGGSLEPKFFITKRMLNKFIDSVISTENLMKTKAVIWPKVEGHRNGLAKKWDYRLVREAIDQSSYIRKVELLELLPKSANAAKEAYQKMSAATD